MQTLLLEDEAPAARRLTRMLLEAAPAAQVVATLQSVAEGLQWFAQNPAPDLILADIELADGRSFDLFARYPPQAPVIFCTAYDAYALAAFEHNGVAYLLKPIDAGKLAAALAKVARLNTPAGSANPNPSDGLAALLAAQQALLAQIASQQQAQSAYRDRFLLRFGERYIPLEASQIGCFAAADKGVAAHTWEGRKLPVDETLDELETQLDPRHFFRVSRGVIAHSRAIAQVWAHLNGKLKLGVVPDPGHEVYVSRERAAAFKAWLGGMQPA